MVDGSDLRRGDRRGAGGRAAGRVLEQLCNIWHSDHSGVIMAKSKSKPAAGGPKRKPRRARLVGALSPEWIDRFCQGIEDKLDPLRFYLKADYNQELDLRDSSLAVLLEAEFGLSRGEVGALTLTKIDYLLGQAHRYKSALTTEGRQRVLTDVAALRSEAENLPNLSPGGAALLKALARFPAPQADEEDPGRDYVTFAEAEEISGLRASNLTKARKSGRIRCKDERKGQLLHGADVIRFTLEFYRRRHQAAEG
jgi:hypothetical protein